MNVFVENLMTQTYSAKSKEPANSYDKEPKKDFEKLVEEKLQPPKENKEVVEESINVQNSTASNVVEVIVLPNLLVPEKEDNFVIPLSLNGENNNEMLNGVSPITTEETIANGVIEITNNNGNVLEKMDNAFNNQNNLQTQELKVLANSTMASQEEVEVLNVNNINNVNNVVENVPIIDENTLKNNVETLAEGGIVDGSEKSFVETIAVKPSIETSTSNLTKEYMDQINSAITKQVLSGKEEFEIQLKPENLGTLTVKAAFENGKVIVSIICTDAETMKAVSGNATDIGNILEMRSGVETQVVVDKDTDNYLQKEKDQESQGGNREDNKNEEPKFKENSDFLQQLRLGLI